MSYEKRRLALPQGLPPVRRSMRLREEEVAEQDCCWRSGGGAVYGARPG